MRTVCVVTGSRADYGLLRPVMQELERRMILRVLVTGMHLIPEVGSTYREIERDGFAISALVSNRTSGDDAPAMARSIGLGILGITDALSDLVPDIVLLLGDRSEILAAAIAASFSGRVLAHIHGGDVSRGGYDEYSRHAITKVAHLHFAATSASGKRIVQLGEPPEKVFVVGSPGLDTVVNADLPSTSAVAMRYGVETGRFVLFVMHPISTDASDAAEALSVALAAASEANLPTIAIFPNTDPGGTAMRNLLGGFAGALRVMANIPHTEYLGLLRDAALLVGNSSSGIIEAPSFQTPVVNVGPRQEGRERASNVLDVPVDEAAIRLAVKTVLYDDEFRARLRETVNPYGDGHASTRIVDVLESVDLGPDLLRKRLLS